MNAKAFRFSVVLTILALVVSFGFTASAMAQGSAYSVVGTQTQLTVNGGAGIANNDTITIPAGTQLNITANTTGFTGVIIIMDAADAHVLIDAGVSFTVDSVNVNTATTSNGIEFADAAGVFTTTSGTEMAANDLNVTGSGTFAGPITSTTGVIITNLSPKFTGSITFNGAGGIDAVDAQTITIGTLHNATAANVTLDIPGGTGAAQQVTYTINDSLVLANGSTLTLAAGTAGSIINGEGDIVLSGVASGAATSVTITATADNDDLAIANDIRNTATAALGFSTPAVTGNVTLSGDVNLDGGKLTLDLGTNVTASDVSAVDTISANTATDTLFLLNASFGTVADDLVLGGSGTLTILGETTARAITLFSTGNATTGGNVVLAELSQIVLNQATWTITSGDTVTITNTQISQFLGAGGVGNVSVLGTLLLSSAAAHASATFNTQFAIGATGTLAVGPGIAADFDDGTIPVTYASGARIFLDGSAASTSLALTDEIIGAATTVIISSSGTQTGANRPTINTATAAGFTLNAADAELQVDGSGTGLIFTGITTNTAAGILDVNNTTQFAAIDMTSNGVGLNLQMNSSTLTVAGNISVPAGVTFAVTGTGSATIANNFALVGSAILDDEFLGTLNITGTMTVAATSTIDLGSNTANVLRLSNAAVTAIPGVVNIDGVGRLQNTAALDIANTGVLTFAATSTAIIDKVESDNNAAEIDVNGSVTISALTFGAAAGVGFDIAPGKALTVTSFGSPGANGIIEMDATTAGGSLKGGTIALDSSITLLNSIADTIFNTITLSGGATINVAANLEISNTISVGASDTLEVRGAGTLSKDSTTVVDLTADGSVLEVGGSVTTTVKNLAISNGGGIVRLNGGNLTATNLTAASGFELDVTQAGAFSIPALTLSSGKIHLLTGSVAGTLAGGLITLNGAQLENDNVGSTILNQITLGASSTLNMDVSVNISQPLTLTGSATIDIAASQTLTYSGTDITLGTNTLTLGGAGTFSNSGNSTILINNASGGLAFTGGATVDSVDVTASEVTITLNGGGGTITDLDNGTNIVNFSFATADTFNVASTLTIPAAKTMTVSGIGGGRLGGAGTIDLADSNSVLILTQSGGTGNLEVGMNVTSTGTNADSLNKAPEIRSTGNVELNGTLTVSNTTLFNLVSGKLTYSGADITPAAGDTLGFTGAGFFELDNQEIILTNAGSAVHFNGGTAGISKVQINGATANIDVGADGTIDTLVVVNATSNVVYTAAKTLTVTDTVVVPTATALILGGKASGTFAGSTPISLSAGTAELQIDTTITVSKPIRFDNATALIDANAPATLSGGISMTTNGTISVAAGKNATKLTTNDLVVSDNTLIFNEAGSLATSSATVVLDSSSSILQFTAAGYVGSAALNNDGATVDANANGIIGTLTTTGKVNLDAAGNTLTVVNAFTVATGDTLDFTGAGTLAGTGDITMADGSVFTTSNAGATISKPLTIGAGGTGKIDGGNAMTVRKLTLAGNSTVNNIAAFTISETLATSAASTLTEDSSGVVDINGVIDMGGDLTLVFSGTADSLNQYNIAGVTNISSSSPSTFTADPDSNGLLDLSAVVVLGDNGDTLSVVSTGTNNRIDVGGAAIGGAVHQAGDDTLNFKDSPSMDSNGELRTNAATAHIVVNLDAVMNMDGLVKPDIGTITFVVDTASFTPTTSAGANGQSVDSVVIAMDDDAFFNVSGSGTLTLPGYYGATMDDDSKINVDGTGTLTGSNSGRFTFGNADANRTKITLTAGTVKWIAFNTLVTGTSTNLDNVNYTTAVFVSPWVSTNGDGTPGSPFNNIDDAITAAAAGAAGGEVRLAAGSYNISTTLTLDNVDLVGSQNTDFTIALVNSWVGGTAGVTDVAPTIYFDGTGPAINVKSDGVNIQGIRMSVASGNTNVVEVGGARDVITELDVRFNDITASAGQRVVNVADSTGLSGADIEWNVANSTDSYTFVYVDEPDSAVSDLDVNNNWIGNAANHLHLGNGDISGVDFDNNTHQSGLGVHIGSFNTVSPTGMFGSLTIQNSTFKGAIGAAFTITASIDSSMIDTSSTLNALFNVNDNHFFNTGEAITNELSGADLSNKDNKVDAGDNWWGSRKGPDQVGGASMSAGVDPGIWKLVPELGGSDLVLTGVASTTTNTSIWVTAYSGFDGSIEFSTNFAAVLPQGAKTVGANVPNAYETQTFEIIALEPKEGAVITIKSGSSTASTNPFTITQAVIAAPTKLNVTDAPNDAGGYVRVKFVPSVNHAGYGTAADDLAIDYYQLYRNVNNNIATAVNWAVLVATPKASGQGDTVRYNVSTNGSIAATAFYWVAAVKGDLPPGLSVNAEGEAPDVNLDERVYLIDQEALSKANVGDEDRVVSKRVGPNRAIAAQNIPGREEDFDGSGTVDITDLALFATFFGNDQEYDELFDLDGNGDLNIFDLARFADKFGTVFDKTADEEVRNDGLNKDMEIKPLKAEEVSGYIEMPIEAMNMTSVAGFAFEVNFDAKRYEFIEIRNENIFDETEAASPLWMSSNTEGRLVVGHVLRDINADYTIAGEMKLATLVLRDLGEGDEFVSVENIQVIDENWNTNILPSVNGELRLLPEVFELKDNYPNPFNPETNISFALPQDESVTIEIYSILGQKVRTLVSNQSFKAGVRTVKWNATNDFGVRVATGMYIYRITAGKNVASKKMVLIK